MKDDLHPSSVALLRLAEYANVTCSIKSDTTADEIATWIRQSFESTRTTALDEMQRQLDRYHAATCFKDGDGCGRCDAARARGSIR